MTRPQKTVAADYAAGSTDPEHIKNDKDLDASRQRDDYKTLLAKLARGQAPAKNR